MGNWEELQVKYMWMTRGENCRICDSMAGRVYPFDTWISAGVTPGFHLGCNCYLKKVADSTPVSSMDVFGSDIDIMLDNYYFLGASLNVAWLPYNRYHTQQVEKIQQETGSSIGEALQSLTKNQKSGAFYSSGFSVWGQFFSWRVFKTLKINQNIDGTYSTTLTPQVATPKALYPGQTYRYTYLQLKNLGIQ